MKIAITGADSDNPNRGLGALTYGTVTALSAQFVGAEILFLDYYKVYPGIREFKCRNGTVQVDTIPLRFSWKPFLRNNVFLILAAVVVMRILPVRKILEVIFPVIRKIRDIDAFFVMSGGDSFSDIYGLQRFVYVVIPQLIMILMKKPVVLLPQTIGPFKKTYARLLSGYIIRNAFRVYSRDFAGIEYVKNMSLRGEKGAPVFCYDLGFMLEPQVTPRTERCVIPEEKSKENIVVGFNVSGLLINGGYTLSNQFGLSSDYMMLCKTAIESLLRKNSEVLVLLVPHVFGGTFENDLVASEKVLENLDPDLKRRVMLFSEEFTSAEVKSVIGRCHLFIGSRMHACIAAVSQCIPAIPLGYSDKFLGVMKTVGLNDVVLDLRVMEQETIIADIQSIYEKRESFRAQLNRKIPEIRIGIEKVFSEMYEEMHI